MKLEQMAEVIIGILVSREEDKDGYYTYRLFNLKAHEEGKNEFSEIRTRNCFDKKLTKQGDIIFRLVCPNKLVYVDNAYENLLIPSQMCIIRPKQNMVDSIFLKWYLESDLCREQILLNVAGSSIQKISVNAVRNIDIPEIEIEKQKKIRDLIELWMQEKNIMEMMIDRKEKLYDSIIEEIIEKKGEE